MDEKVGKGRSPNSLKNLKHIKKGQVMNPEGARAHDPVKKELKRFTNKYLRDIIELAVMGNLAGLQAVVKDPNAPAIQVGVAKALADAVVNGNWSILESIVSRVIGKVPDRIHLGGDDEASGITVEFIGTSKK